MAGINKDFKRNTLEWQMKPVLEEVLNSKKGSVNIFSLVNDH